MFQYAFGRRVAVESGQQVKFDIDSGFKSDPYRRRFSLGFFNKKSCAPNPRSFRLVCPGAALGTGWQRQDGRRCRQHGGWGCRYKKH